MPRSPGRSRRSGRAHLPFIQRAFPSARIRTIAISAAWLFRKDASMRANSKLMQRSIVGAREQRLWYRDAECLTPPPLVLNRHCARLRLPTEVSRPRHRTRQLSLLSAAESAVSVILCDLLHRVGGTVMDGPFSLTRESTRGSIATPLPVFPSRHSLRVHNHLDRCIV